MAKAVRRLLLSYKKHIKTITTDNGPGFAAHKLITKYLGAVVYFADPYASWQKGAIENTNRVVKPQVRESHGLGFHSDLQFSQRIKVFEYAKEHNDQVFHPVKRFT